jgi:hypothetical protein
MTRGRSDYYERREARIDRMAAKADRNRAESDALLEANRPLLEAMAGTPVLRGHHSEKRHLRDLDRINSRMSKAVQLDKDAARLERRAKAAEASDAISSDAPDAVERIRQEIAEAEAFRDRWKAINKALRSKREDKRRAAVLELKLTPEEIRTIKCSTLDTGYVTTNAGANIRRLKQRLIEIQQADAADGQREEFDGGYIEQSENRVRVYLDSKPSRELCKLFRSRGFVFSRNAGNAWQRKANEFAWRAAREAVDVLRKERATRRGPEQPSLPPVLNAATVTRVDGTSSSFGCSAVAPAATVRVRPRVTGKSAWTACAKGTGSSASGHCLSTDSIGTLMVVATSTEWWDPTMFAGCATALIAE